MKYLPWALATLGAIIILALLINPTIAPRNIGIVDMGRILNESPQAQQLNEKFSEKYEQLIAQLQIEADDIDTERADYERAIYSEYLRFRQELDAQFQVALNEAIAAVAEAENLELVFDEDLVRYGGTDISNLIIKNLQ